MAMDKGLRETFVSEETIYRGRVFTVSERMVTLPNGKTAKRELIHHFGAAAVVPVDENGIVTLVRQYRIAHDTVMLEIPAGKLDSATEDTLSCAHRELQEEAGLLAGNMRLLTRMTPTPGYDTEFVDIYLATELSPGTAHLDEDEFLLVERMPLAQAVEHVMRGEMGDAKTAIGLLMAARLLC
ncbi:MAG TPA: NUDIX hydrolase [Candidatus Limiplasma sp.]|nr:NUDIX hydrolase [Candidatus Limiplasma sp.]HRX07676.1 NUDIX hydrolase [Candidatus Limiplasma sp.]